MAGIADTINRLQRMRSAFPQHSDPAQDGRLVDIDTFGSNPGNLRARLYAPDDRRPNAPLVVVLHGCTQSASGYDASAGWTELADRYGFVVLFPEQRRANNPNLCFNWFVPADVQRGSGEALSIKQMIDTVHARHAIDPARVFVTGLSAGGAMASVMLATYPETFAGGSIIAGLPYGMADTVPAALQLMGGRTPADPIELMAKVRSASRHQGSWPKVAVWHGTADRTVDASNAVAVIDQWRLIHDLPAEPGRTEVVNGFPRRAWCDADGKELIAEYMIPGMAHGAPLDTASGTGTAAAFMLDVGICSTVESLRFWGLLDGPPREKARSKASSGAAPVKNDTLELVDPATHTFQQPPPSRRPAESAAPSYVSKVIEDALRAAGLMR